MRDPEKRRLWKNAWAAKHRVKLQRKKTESRDRKLEKFAGRPRPAVCDVCQKPPAEGRKLHFDHDHKTQKFRGWLCQPCNMSLGLLNDDSELLLQLALYLERSRNSK